jgi:hypothetical protein
MRLLNGRGRTQARHVRLERTCAGGELGELGGLGEHGWLMVVGERWLVCGDGWGGGVCLVVVLLLVLVQPTFKSHQFLKTTLVSWFT